MKDDARSAAPESPASAIGADNVTWNLDDLVAPPADRGIERILMEAERRMAAFAERYRGRIAALSADEMRELLSEYEELLQSVGRAESYASLSWSTQSADPARGALLQRYRSAIPSWHRRVSSRFEG